MPSFVALCAFLAFVAWLCFRGPTRSNKISIALWIPLAWAFLISSKPLSLWLNSGGELDANGYVEDTLLDKLLFVFLIVAGIMVLFRRRPNWQTIIARNKWLFLFFLYLGFSVLWADDSFVSFKRWFKHLGNLVMVLVVVSEDDPVEAVRSFVARWAYLIVPFSVLLIKYYPGLSRRYDIWTSEPAYVGMSTDKNTFGMSLFVCGVTLFWLLLQARGAKLRLNRNLGLAVCCLLLAMTAWLLRKSQSSTALSCTVLGCGILGALRITPIRHQVKRLGTYIVAIGMLVFLFQISGLWGLVLQQFAGAVGRDASLHGRTDIWQAVLKEDINPLVGVGFYSFWSTERNKRLSEKYYYQLGEAHNGYIETYLNSGVTGLVLLLMTIASATKKIKQQVLGGSDLGDLRLALLLPILIYNITESAFDRLVPIFFALILIVVEYPRVRKSNNGRGNAPGNRALLPETGPKRPAQEKTGPAFAPA